MQRTIKDVSPASIFIGGMQRSGTSLMRALIGSHADMAVLQTDVPIWSDYHEKYAHLDFSRFSARVALLSDLLTHPKMQLPIVSQEQEALLKAIRDKDEYSFGTIIRLIMDRLTRRLGKSRWALKMPESEFYADHIYRFFPSGSMIQMIRDPRDVACSIKQRGWPYNIWNHRVKWQESINQSIDNERRYPRYVTVHYEDLVTNPETVMKRVCRLIGLEFQPEMLHLSGFTRQLRDSSSFGNIVAAAGPGHVITAKAIGRFHSCLDKAEISLYDAILEQLGDRTPYRPTSVKASPPPNLWFGAAQRMVKQCFLPVFKLGRQLRLRTTVSYRCLKYRLSSHEADHATPTV